MYYSRYMRRWRRPPTSRIIDPGGTPTDKVTNIEQERRKHLTVLLADTREELNRADSKAAILVAGSGVGISALLAGLIAGRWEPFELDNRVEWLWWFGSATVISGTIFLAAAIYPRTRRKGSKTSGSICYYGDVARFKTVEDFKQELLNATELTDNRLFDQVFNVSKIAAKKYTCLQWGLRLLGAGAVLTTSSTLIQLALR
jgi:hypothetical protein